MGSGHWAWGIGDWAAGERANDLSASARDQRERCHRVTAGRGGDTHAARRPRGRWCTPPTALLDQRRCVRVVEGLSGVLTGACASWRSLQTHAPHGADATLIPPRRPKHSRQQAVPETGRVDRSRGGRWDTGRACHTHESWRSYTHAPLSIGARRTRREWESHHPHLPIWRAVGGAHTRVMYGHGVRVVVFIGS